MKQVGMKLTDDDLDKVKLTEDDLRRWWSAEGL